MSRLRKIAATAAAAALVLAVAACGDGGGSGGNGGGNGGGGGGAGGGDAPRETQKIRIMTTQAAWTISYSPLIAADQMGFFADEGIEVEWLNDSSAANVATQVQQGNVEIGIVSPEPVLIGHETGDFDALYYSSMFRKSIFGVAVPEDSDIQTAADLEGKRIGVTSLGASGVPIAEAVARDAGVDPATLEFLAIGTGAQAMAALEGGEVDALSLFDTQYQTFENNGVALRELDLGEIVNLTSGGLLALPENIEADPELYVGAARAVAKGVLFTAENPEATVRLFWEQYPESRAADMSEEEALEDQLSILNKRLTKYNLDSTDEQWGSFPEGSIQALIDFMAAAGTIEGTVTPEDIHTTEYIDQIDDFDREEVAQAARDFTS